MDFTGLLNGIVANPITAGILVKAIVSALKVWVLKLNGVTLSSSQLGLVHTAIVVLAMIGTVLTNLVNHSMDQLNVEAAVQYFVSVYAMAVAAHEVPKQIGQVVAAGTVAK